MVTFISDSFTCSDSQIPGGEVLQQKKRPTVLFLGCPFLHRSWLLSVAQEVTIANTSIRQSVRRTLQK